MNCLACCSLELGLVYGVQLILPLVKTVKAIKQDGRTQLAIDHMLSYWFMFFILQLIETIVFVIPMIPLYQYLKSLICFWMVSDHYQGSMWIYAMFIKSHYAALSDKINPHLVKIFGEIQKQEVKQE